ncbi:hypothetical protein ACL02S_18390 [Nocardia sp. 004]|uniref:hypothetical protein n=1 Tax=Nocardia sp. 004 TaxID=3385978 RepID=UPI0039A1A5FE
MGEFLAAAFAFPTALFTFALVVVLGYWLLVLVGAADLDLLDGIKIVWPARVFEFLGSGVPVTVTITGSVSISWFTSLAGTAAIHAAGIGGIAAAAVGFAVLVVAVVMAVAGTRAIVLPLRRLLRGSAPPSQQDFLGRVCVIRTSHVDSEFGQAELISADGSSAVIQVRQSRRHASTVPLSQGDPALVYDYNQTTGTFSVAATEGD